MAGEKSNGTLNAGVAGVETRTMAMQRFLRTTMRCYYIVKCDLFGACEHMRPCGAWLLKFVAPSGSNPRGNSAQLRAG